MKNVYVARGACIYATQMLLLPKKKREKETKGGKIKKLKKDKDGSKKIKAEIPGRQAVIHTQYK